jgi:hypothetical protein
MPALRYVVPATILLSLATAASAQTALPLHDGRKRAGGQEPRESPFSPGDCR